MLGVIRPFVSAVLAVVLSFAVAAAAGGKQFEGTWSSELYYEGTNYTLELALSPNDDGDISGVMRVLDSGYLVETVGFKSVELRGDSLVIQTNSVDGRAAKFALAGGGEQLSGLFWEVSYSGDAHGEGMEMVFKAKKE